MGACLMGVVLVPLVLAWGYVMRQYVRAPGMVGAGRARPRGCSGIEGGGGDRADDYRAEAGSIQHAGDGIRIALGAAGRDVFGLVARQAAGQVGIGLGIGMALAFGVTGLIRVTRKHAGAGGGSRVPAGTRRMRRAPSPPP